MKLELNQNEIEAALVEYVGSQGISIAERKIDVHMVAGRGGNGFTAHITIDKEVAEKTAETVVPEIPGTEPADKDNLFKG